MTLGLHINTWTTEARATVRKTNPPILKVLSSALDVGEIRRWREAVGPNGILVYRYHWKEDEQTLDDPVSKAGRLLQAVAPIRDIVDYVEGYNECYQRRGDLARYAHFCVQFAEVIHQAELRFAVGSFSTGNPDLALWSEFYPALEVADALSLHEYSFPTMQQDESWKCLRYRRVWDLLPARYRKRILITECGLDDGEKHGWRSWATPAHPYPENLRWYLQEIQKDDYVLGATIYCCGQFGDWAEYDVAGVQQIEQLLVDQPQPGRRQPEPQPEHPAINRGGAAMSFVVGEGFQNKLTALGDQPATNEIWHPSGEYSECYTKNGRHLVYVRETEEVLVFDQGH